jgi:hypothetical protein
LSVRNALVAAALASLVPGGCRDALDGDACLAVCERRITCDQLAELERAGCEQACLDGGACDPGAADRCARCLVAADCDDLDDKCEAACADPCDPGGGGAGGTGGTGGIDAPGGSGGAGGAGEP